MELLIGTTAGTTGDSRLFHPYVQRTMGWAHQPRVKSLDWAHVSVHLGAGLWSRLPTPTACWMEAVSCKSQRLLRRLRSKKGTSITLPLTPPCGGAAGGANGSISFLASPFEEKKKPKATLLEGKRGGKSKTKPRDRCGVPPGPLSRSGKPASLQQAAA